MHVNSFNIVVRDDEKVKPLIRKKDVGMKATFKCDSSGTVSWYFEPSADNPITFPLFWNKRLNLFAVEPKDIGYYFCYGTYSDNKRHFLAKAELKLYGMLIDIFTLHVQWDEDLLCKNAEDIVGTLIIKLRCF